MKASKKLMIKLLTVICVVMLISTQAIAAPSTDNKAVTGVSFSRASDILAVGDEKELKVIVSPDDATDKTVAWSTSDESVVSIDQAGKVTAKAKGSATITATTTDGEKAASLSIEVVGTGDERDVKLVKAFAENAVYKINSTDIANESDLQNVVIGKVINEARTIELWAVYDMKKTVTTVGYQPAVDETFACDPKAKDGVYTFTVTLNKGDVTETTKELSMPIFHKTVSNSKVSIQLDANGKHQTMDGFGFFGAQKVWQDDGGVPLVDEKWLNTMFKDLGATVWRNELYPNIPVNGDATGTLQDWKTQKPAVQAIVKKAKQLRIPLKIILTVWSPPGEWKVKAGDTWSEDQFSDRTEYYGSTKGGGTLNPKNYADYANWLIAGIKMYKDAGADLYGISLQNEPLFDEPYNSAQYTPAWYVELLNNVVPKIKKIYPNVKIYGAEGMLEHEVTDWHVMQIHKAIVQDPQAIKNIDVFAVHGYSDGVRASAIENHKAYWTKHKQMISDPSHKPTWMTETSGYVNEWRGKDGTPGAFDLGIAIQSALAYGDVSAWVWWQGSENQLSGDTQYILTHGTSEKQWSSVTDKKFEVSKQFYRFIRPNSVRIESTVTNPKYPGLLTTAYKNDKLGNTVVVLVNTENTDLKAVSLNGKGMPNKYKYYITSSNSNDNCRLVGEVNANKISIPAKSVVTLVSGSVTDK
ncbi:hypothetical protein GZH47_31970 (plasmid) [Paenibacillus rhizovicinus]|uniref:BIG2 domain-containing protein n=1 Tax=Paenibacillus rhizovicinus TaxID=2704463 RepID=A0A6C0PAJ2_9BACL|nr:Ig-like domain-containing protein [Paenibacillus rhizovicinus]QHW35509.1 hypothetical protein GZH47_31970 [Paenibacillus rhizovicinus]